jgi:hypothetical protein
MHSPVPNVNIYAHRAMGGALLLAAAGCGTGRALYRPLIPRVAEGAGLRAEITGLDLPNIPRATRVSVVLETGTAPPPPALSDARLSVGSAAPCESGTRARRVWVDGQARADRPTALAVGAPARLGLEYATTDPLSGEAFVDLLVDAGGEQGWRCLRLPLVGEDPRLGWRSADGWTLGGALRLDGTLYGLVRLGRWVGALRIGVEAGVGLTDCLVSCPSPEPLLPARRNYPSGLTFDVFPLQWGAFALGVEAALEVFWRSERHGPAAATRFTLRLALVPPPRHGLPRGPHMGFGSFDLATRHWVTTTGSEDRGYVQMLGVTWDFGL